MRAQILTVIESVVENKDITVDSIVSESLDSIAFIKIIVALEKKYGIEFDDDMLSLSEFTTIDHLINYVVTKVESLPI